MRFESIPCSKMRLAGILPRTPLGELTALPRPSVAGFKGGASRRRGETEGKRREERGRERVKRNRDGGKGESKEVGTRPLIG